MERAREAEAEIAASTAIHLVRSPPSKLIRPLMRPEGSLARGTSGLGSTLTTRRKVSRGLRNGARLGSARLRSRATGPLVNALPTKAWGGFGSCSGRSSRTRSVGAAPGRRSGQPERVIHQEPNIQRVLDFESRLQGSRRRIASWRRLCVGERSFAGTLALHGRGCEARPTWRRCPGWTASRCQVTRCAAEWV